MPVVVFNQSFGDVSPYVCSYFYIGLGCWVTTFWDIAAHSVGPFVLIVLCLFVNQVISHFGLEGGVCLLIAPVPVYCLFITKIQTNFGHSPWSSTVHERLADKFKMSKLSIHRPMNSSSKLDHVIYESIPLLTFTMLYYFCINSSSYVSHVICASTTLLKLIILPMHHPSFRFHGTINSIDDNVNFLSPRSKTIHITKFTKPALFYMPCQLFPSTS